MKQSLAELKQIMLTHVANRTFKKDPGLLDQLATRLITSASGGIPAEDPDLAHPDDSVPDREMARSQHAGHHQ